MTKNVLKFLAVAITLLMLAACGSGDTKTTVAVTIGNTGALPVGTSIMGTEMIITLPDNVTPSLVGGKVASGVVVPSGTYVGGVMAEPVYTAATPSAKATLLVIVGSAKPLGETSVGEIATLTLHFSGDGSSAQNFTIEQSSAKVKDTIGNVIPGMGAAVTGVMLR